MTKKKIAWITPSCFVDVDLPIIKELQIVYDIHWYVIVQRDSFYKTIDEPNFIEHLHVGLQLKERVKGLIPTKIIQKLKICMRKR